MIKRIIYLVIAELLVLFFFIDITFFAGWLEDTDPDFDPEKAKEKNLSWYKKGWRSIFLDVSIFCGGWIFYVILFYGFDGSWCYAFCMMIARYFLKF